jgi:(1->4)-alpha-D-glucan 1-alpha-D-glucosylmutase
MTTPRATIRLQFHRGFTFADARSFVPYFAALGISHVYASPIMTARPGSMHGYDVVDPTRINPELGGEDEFRQFVAELRRNELGLIVDIVPNHMAIGRDNAWWTDVLAQGRRSRYARYFDIDWNPPNRHLEGKVLLPVLARPYGEALDAGEITLGRDDEGGGFIIRYRDHTLPLAPGEAFTYAAVTRFDPSLPGGRDRLHSLLEKQNYRLAWWRTANDEINWRRFFDINELAAIRVEDGEVFEAVHAGFFRLYAEGLIDGVRVDHVDGLSDPEKYCGELRERLRALENKRPSTAPPGPAYFVVEKILARNEILPSAWQTNGTTGYDFMDEVSALLHDPAGELALGDLWQDVSGRPGDFNSEEELARRQILERSFSALRNAVVESLYAVAQARLDTRDYSRAAIQRCLTEVLAHFPVYRIYARVNRASQADCAFLSQAIRRAKSTCFPGDRSLLTTLHEWLCGKRIHPSLDQLLNIALERFEQLSAPLCAKAVEDTAFYRYGRLISRNDVGFDARQFARSVGEFHRRMQRRATNLPYAMLTTATHDHKRGEDVRARLAVLSELSEEWGRTVKRWIELSQRFRQTADSCMPSAGDLAILFQTVVGAWPLGLTPTDRRGLSAYCERVARWQQKALREAKLHSDWSSPNERYERAAHDYVVWLFSDRSELSTEIALFAQQIAAAGAVNGLAQALTKLTAPGVPDIYQGTEYWDLSLVDPDNRLPVDFAARQKSLHAVAQEELLANWYDGRLKQFLIARVLAARKETPRLFSDGAYRPLETSGPMAEQIVAFARSLSKSSAIVAFCRSSVRHLHGHPEKALGVLRCKQTRVSIPPDLQGHFSDALGPERKLWVGSDIDVGQLLSRLPVAFLTSISGQVK